MFSLEYHPLNPYTSPVNSPASLLRIPMSGNAQAAGLQKLKDQQNKEKEEVKPSYRRNRSWLELRSAGCSLTTKSDPLTHFDCNQFEPHPSDRAVAAGVLRVSRDDTRPLTVDYRRITTETIFVEMCKSGEEVEYLRLKEWHSSRREK
ncbi:hypothetical protein PROFUN_16464 [Planoprotostelium fungivorum]|uniref:Uncharacterized protein n=1 Tax=Planoprotostelium fungivorum TaxID=1890364 RepID=A0A2P6MQP5_9EUKA|nr:hypothetical protein PROFUN_16464 [Planoprotostelium fungivorum]